MGAAIHTSHPQCRLLPRMLACFRNLKIRSNYSTEMAYGWCSMVCESHSSPWNRETLLLALEIGFRHINPEDNWMEAKLTHMESHQQMVGVVFQSGESEAIADLLCAWTLSSDAHKPHPSLKICAEYLVGLSHLQPFPPRLRKAIIESIGLIHYQGFEQFGMERYIELLDWLHLCVEDLINSPQLTRELLAAIESPGGVQHVPHQYWEWLVESLVSWGNVSLSPYTMTLLEDTKEWDKLECWMGMVWVLWSKGATMDQELETDEKLDRITLSLFQQRPGAVQKLEQWVGKLSWTERQRSTSFQQAFDQAYPNAEQKAAL